MELWMEETCLKYNPISILSIYKLSININKVVMEIDAKKNVFLAHRIHIKKIE